MNKVPLKLSFILILIYITLANVGSILSEKININYLGQIVLLFIFSVLLIIYLKKHELTKAIGLIKISLQKLGQNLLYIPLFLMVLANGVFFFDRTLSVENIILAIVFMLLVAFLEELLFRGILFKSIEECSTTKTAILVSGATFGFGHIINLINGYTTINQIIQIVIASLIGIILSTLFVCTKSIVPGIIFHFIFNSTSILSRNIEPLYNYISVSIILVIGSVYLFYLLKIKLNLQEENEQYL